jgi:aldose 1-epimerase
MRDLRGGRAFGPLKLDDVLTGLEFSGGWAKASIRDPNCGRTVTVRFDGAFGQCVVYTPPHREAVCIEPYSCVPCSFPLEASGATTGLWHLSPREKRQGRVTVEVE